jgi:hypothetical protein
MPAVVRIGDIRSDLITFAVDDRPNFLGDQWLSLYLASDDQRYLVPTSFPAYTVIGKGVFRPRGLRAGRSGLLLLFGRWLTS